MSKNFICIMSIAALGIILSSCEDDDDKYRSEPPVFSDMIVKSLTDGSDKVHVGDRFTVTLQQRKKGLRLNTTQYSWSASPSDGISHKYTRSVIYDQENQNPVDTLVATAAGKYRINFTGKYNASGNTQPWSEKHGTSFSVKFDSGEGQATYTTGGILYFTVQAFKDITVMP